MTLDFSVVVENAAAFAQGVATTLAICSIALPVGFAAGTVFAFVRLYAPAAARAVVLAYVEATRNVPFLIQLFLLFFALPSIGIRLDALQAGTIALASYAAAYFAEIVRGAISTIPAGQTQAARALGLRTVTIFRRVLLPQVSGYIVPAGGVLIVTLIKESAVLCAITVRELTYMSQNVVGRTFAPVEVFTVVALLYWALTALVSSAAARLERRLSLHRPSVQLSSENHS
jgi:His/Glu/Gln/Arg/opine family amino acid ABC transporter permease subunit